MSVCASLPSCWSHYGCNGKPRSTLNVINVMGNSYPALWSGMGENLHSLLLGQSEHLEAIKKEVQTAPHGPVEDVS